MDRTPRSWKSWPTPSRPECLLTSSATFSRALLAAWSGVGGLAAGVVGGVVVVAGGGAGPHGPLVFSGGAAGVLAPGAPPFGRLRGGRFAPRGRAGEAVGALPAPPA